MRLIQHLDDHDYIEPGDFFRPLCLVYEGQSDYLQTSNAYSGLPMNHMKWLQVERGGLVLWIGSRVIDVNFALERFGTAYEFARGDINPNSILSETDQEREKRVEAERRATVMRVGKYKGLTGEEIRKRDPSYYDWLIRQGLLVSK